MALPDTTATPGPEIARTARLRLRPLHDGDADAVQVLHNDADFLRHIGDKGVRSREDALRYLRDGPLASYAAHGFGLWAVEDAADGAWLGMCGLLRRDWLDAPDIGYAFLPAARGRGIAQEAADAVLALARTRFGLERVLAIVTPHNAASIRLLERAGLRDAGAITAPGDSTELRLYSTPPR
jgi:RimJ/RimL family protein N-acetyltransferase